MPHRLSISVSDVPASDRPASILAVDRAVGDLRRGQVVVIVGDRGNLSLALAAEAVTPSALESMTRLCQGDPSLIISGARAEILGFAIPQNTRSVRLEGAERLCAEQARQIADPLECDHLPEDQKLQAHPLGDTARESAAVGLAKLARLLPACLVADIAKDQRENLRELGLLEVAAADIFRFEQQTSASLRAISDARVPLLDAQETRIIAFRPADGGIEHLAIIIGTPDPQQPVLARLHSECFTGDLLGSLRCDCGDQLRGAIQQIASEGAGVLLYLAQEGRGIGLVNKLRAYSLQDRGVDTFDANRQLGFDEDERVYLPAAEMLRQLGFKQIRLMTNNPDKVEVLARCGLEVVERVAHAFPSNQHNELYLEAKATKGGHLF